MKRLLALVATIVLVGAGCGAAPADEYRSAEELKQAMEEEMKRNPPPELPEIEVVMHEETAREMLAQDETLKSGDFAAKAHKGEGTASLIRKDGKLFVVFDAAFATDAGPRLHVFLAGHPNPGSSAELHAQDAIDLGPLLRPAGAQIYEVPDAEAGKTWGSVVVYCVPFKVVFAAASLQ